jgi:hypothetical protein
MASSSLANSPSFGFDTHNPVNCNHGQDRLIAEAPPSFIGQLCGFETKLDHGSGLAGSRPWEEKKTPTVHTHVRVIPGTSVTQAACFARFVWFAAAEFY